MSKLRIPSSVGARADRWGVTAEKPVVPRPTRALLIPSSTKARVQAWGLAAAPVVGVALTDEYASAADAAAYDTPVKNDA